VVWDLTLLVQDPSQAAETLIERGYHQIAQAECFMDYPEFSKCRHRLSRPPTEGGSKILLLPASDWDYSLDAPIVYDGFLPTLHDFLDSLMEVWLNISERNYVDRLRFALYIAVLIVYCYELRDGNGEDTKTVNYARNLKEEHRELHYDIVAADSKTEDFISTRRHRYHARKYREIKEGAFTPKPYKKGSIRLELGTLVE
jgi:hypothetical protein